MSEPKWVSKTNIPTHNSKLLIISADLSVILRVRLWKKN